VLNEVSTFLNSKLRDCFQASVKRKDVWTKWCLELLTASHEHSPFQQVNVPETLAPAGLGTVHFKKACWKSLRIQSSKKDDDKLYIMQTDWKC
jgi:hypothetical protein